MKTLYESLLDDVDLMDSTDTIIDCMASADFTLCRDVFYEKIKESSKRIKTNPKDIQYGEIIQPNKIYVVFRPKYPEQITLLYKPVASKNNLCQMNTSYVRSRAHLGGYRWTTCKSFLRIVAYWMDNTYELYELPKNYYPLWDKIHKRINPNDNAFDVK